MEELWSRFLSLLRQQVPEAENWLNAGATAEQMRAVEELIEAHFPDDAKAFYKVHNGQKHDSNEFWLGGELLSLERIAEEWSTWKGLLDEGKFDSVKSAPQGPIKDDWWNPLWIPITYNGAGDHHCLDLTPEEGGKVGQIIDFWHDDATRTLTAPSLHVWFETFVISCETGVLVWSDEEEAFVEPDEL